jgi:tetratricopeptide (TPR) repeat protein
MDGNSNDALQKAENSLELNNGNADAFYVAGKALLALGKNDEAKERFNAALRCDGNHRDSQDALKKNKNLHSHLSTDMPLSMDRSK